MLIGDLDSDSRDSISDDSVNLVTRKIKSLSPSKQRNRYGREAIDEAIKEEESSDLNSVSLSQTSDSKFTGTFKASKHSSHFENTGGPRLPFGNRNNKKGDSSEDGYSYGKQPSKEMKSVSSDSDLRGSSDSSDVKEVFVTKQEVS